MEKIVTIVLNWYFCLSPTGRKMLKYPMVPLVNYKIEIMGKKLIEEKLFRPSTTWDKFKRDGLYVNMGPVSQRRVVSDGKTEFPMLIGRYSDNTVRVVYNVPLRFQEVGTTF